LSLNELPRQSLRPARLPLPESLYGMAYGLDSAPSNPPKEFTISPDNKRASGPPGGRQKSRSNEPDPPIENVMAALRTALDEIRHAVTFGEEKRAVYQARHAVKLARNARRQESRELLLNESDLLKPVLLRSLGGSQRRVSIVPGNQVDSSRLSPEHLFLLSRVDGTTTIEELLDTSPLSAAETLGILLDFRDLGCLGIE
jgi:hypothetical protein